MGSNRKRPATLAQDRISALPDALVSHILSYLPTIDAVRTTVLSTRWNNETWTLVPNLDFVYGIDSRLWSGMSGCESFMSFVDRVLLFRGSSDIPKLRFECIDDLHMIDVSRVQGWICAVVCCNVVELDLNIELCYRRIFELPQSLFTCKTLQVLRMLSTFITNPPETGCFPSLKVLVVQVASNSDNTSLEKLFSSCPQLEDLTLRGSLTSDMNISAPQLKMVTIDNTPRNEIREYRLHIIAPALDYFDLQMNDLSGSSFEINSNSNDLSANIYLGPYAVQPDRITGLLEAIANVKHLSISNPNLQDCQIPVFNNLNRLKLVSGGNWLYCYWKFLELLLNKTPNLEDLAIVDNNPYKESEQRWSSSNSVPICLLLHLKTISMSGFKGWPIENEVAKYLLKNGKFLEKMTISTEMTISTGLEELNSEFLTFPKGSVTCQVQLIKN